MSRAATLRTRHAAHAMRSMRVSRAALILFASLWTVALGNVPFWRTFWQSEGGLHSGNVLFLLTAPLAAMAWTYIILLGLAWGRATKLVLGVVLLASAIAGYFTYTYGVLVDGNMVANVVQTHTGEARELLSWRMAGWVGLFGVFPTMLIASVRTTGEPLLRELGTKALHSTFAAACIAAVLMLNYQNYASTLRNHRELRLMLVPHNIVAALHGYFTRRLSVPAALQAVGTDARRMAAAESRRKPMLAVLVVGETARAQNFSLNGYPRPTNPELMRQDVLSFSNVSACGTSTAVSLPCMFADVGRARYDDSLGLRREGLLDVLQHAGISVLWRDNNSGCKGVCARVPHQERPAMHASGLCREGDCYDKILLEGLQDYVDGLRDDALIVLHMNGSHGPAYYKRYPQSFETFTPACHTAELDRCSRESILNAYDNSIRYTDHVLSRAIEFLRVNGRRFDTAMVYVSDHGESLGEKGLYLHGIPYALAPREQIHVPLLVWLSHGMYDRLRIDRACLAAHQKDPLSHDNVFHSMLGLSMVHTAAYAPALDIFQSCRA